MRWGGHEGGEGKRVTGRRVDGGDGSIANESCPGAWDGGGDLGAVVEVGVGVEVVVEHGGVTDVGLRPRPCPSDGGGAAAGERTGRVPLETHWNRVGTTLAPHRNAPGFAMSHTGTRCLSGVWGMKHVSQTGKYKYNRANNGASTFFSSKAGEHFFTQTPIQ